MFTSFFFLSGFLSKTFVALGVNHFWIRDQGDPQDFTEYSDPATAIESSFSIATASETEEPGETFDLAISPTVPLSFDPGTVDNLEELPASSDNLVIPIDSNPEDLLAFHDGDFSPEGWGDCDFPKVPACCKISKSGTECVWFTFFGEMCPDHPDEIWPPRTEEEKARNQPMCCNQIINNVGIGCVPVQNRVEDGTQDDWFSYLEYLNKLHVDPAPDSCKSAYRRDEQIGPQCLAQKQ